MDKGEMSALGLELADERVDVTLARAYGADIDDLGVVFLGDVGYGNALFMDIQSDIERARLLQG